MRYHLCYHTFMGVSYCLQSTIIISLLLHWLLSTLLFIFSKISTYFYDFQRVTTRYHQIFKKRSVLTFLKKLIVTPGKVFENW